MSAESRYARSSETTDLVVPAKCLPRVGMHGQMNYRPCSASQVSAESRYARSSEATDLVVPAKCLPRVGMHGH